MFLHPFKVQTKIAYEREHGGYSENYGVDRYEAVSVSWIWYIVHSMFTIAFLYFSNIVFNKLETDGSLSASLFSELKYESLRLIIVFILLGIVFFPFYKFLYIKIFTGLTKFFCRLFNIDMQAKEIERVVSCSLCGNVFLLVPIFGNFLTFISTAFYLFAGLKNNIKLTNLQAAVVIVSPFILVTAIFMSFVFFLTLLLGGMF